MNFKLTTISILMAISPSLVLAAPSIDVAQRSLEGIKRSQLSNGSLFSNRTFTETTRFNLGLLVNAGIYTQDVQSLFDRYIDAVNNDATADINVYLVRISGINESVKSLIDAKLKTIRSDKGAIEMQLASANQMLKTRAEEIDGLRKQIQADKDLDAKVRAEYDARLNELDRQQRNALLHRGKLRDDLAATELRGQITISQLEAAIADASARIGVSSDLLERYKGAFNDVTAAQRAILAKHGLQNDAKLNAVIGSDGLAGQLKKDQDKTDRELNGLRKKLATIESNLKLATGQNDARVREAARALEDFNTVLAGKNLEILAMQSKINSQIQTIIACQTEQADARSAGYNSQIAAIEIQKNQISNSANDSIRDLSIINSQIKILEQKF